MARELFGRMDARPALLTEAARIAYDDLNNIRLRDTLLANVIARAPRQAKDLLPWYVSLAQGPSVLKRVAEETDLKPEARSEALKLLLRSSPAERDYVLDRFRQLISIAPDNIEVVDAYADCEENSGRPGEAARVLQDWLKTNSSKRDLAWIHVATRLSEKLQKQGKLEEAWRVVAAVVGSGKSETLMQAAAVLEARGEHEQAREMARNNLERYPSSGDASAALAEILWRQHDDAGAADLLRQKDKFLTRTDWYYPIAEAFARVFAEAPIEAAQKAFDEIARRGFDPERVSALIGPLSKRNRHDLASALSQRVPLARQTIYDWLRTYREIKASSGPTEALDWLKKRIPPAAVDGLSTAFYHQGEYDLLWDFIADRPDQTKNHMLQFFRAASLVRLRTPRTDPRWQRLAHEFESVQKRDAFIDYGRYLLGLDAEDKLLASVPRARCDTAYLLGIKNFSERRYEKAMDWFQAALETGETATPLYNSAVAFLSGWARTEKSFARIDAEGL